MTEKEYIEREAAIANSREYNLDGSYDDTERAVPVDAINAIPAADVRPVVLCKNCKHNMANIHDFQDGMNINENWNACQLTELYDSVKPDDFCSHGVKKEE